jgi:hypothetical protein
VQSRQIASAGRKVRIANSDHDSIHSRTLNPARMPQIRTGPPVAALAARI